MYSRRECVTEIISGALHFVFGCLVCGRCCFRQLFNANRGVSVGRLGGWVGGGWVGGFYGRFSTHSARKRGYTLSADTLYRRVRYTQVTPATEWKDTLPLPTPGRYPVVKISAKRLPPPAPPTHGRILMCRIFRWFSTSTLASF